MFIQSNLLIHYNKQVSWNAQIDKSKRNGIYSLAH